MRLAAVIAFASGVRVGELFGLKKEQCKKNQVYVSRQLTRKRGYDDTKTGRERFLYCTNDGAKALTEWFKIPEPERNLFRRKTGVINKQHLWRFEIGPRLGSATEY